MHIISAKGRFQSANWERNTETEPLQGVEIHSLLLRGRQGSINYYGIWILRIKIKLNTLITQHSFSLCQSYIVHLVMNILILCLLNIPQPRCHSLSYYFYSVHTSLLLTCIQKALVTFGDSHLTRFFLFVLSFYDFVLLHEFFVDKQLLCVFIGLIF